MQSSMPLSPLSLTHAPSHVVQVSPTCNCVRNTHVEYVKAVTPNGIHLPESVMDNEQSKRNRLWISNRLKMECFQSLRHTQVFAPRCVHAVLLSRLHVL